ncbi:MAG TPA: O-antigen ligase [Rhizomicrobium sp.]|jgi:exopolysaccharide production protein ExoQ|nr:O-antigen ligase [Rhizomicrobium sp.]
MATEGFASSIVPARPSLDTRIAEAGFVLLLLLIFVGVHPFEARNAASVGARAMSSATGDSLRQVAYLGVFALVVYSAARKHGLAAIRAIPVLLGVLMLWCLVTASWADEPDLAARRAVLALTLVVSVLLSVDTLGAQRAVILWRNVVACVIIADWISVALVHQAIHLPDDVEADLAGSWRGLHSHKNTAGFVAATAAAMFLYFSVATRRWTDMVLLALSLGFLVMTRSKSSMGLLPLALAAGGLYRVALRNKLDRSIAAVAAMLFLLVFAVVVTVQWEFIARFLEDPQHFTGRSAIWQAEVAYIRDNPLFGAGYGTFTNTGVRSPIYPYVGGGWVADIGEGHSGYLEMLVTIGGIGFVLAMAALVAEPFVEFWRTWRRDDLVNALLFTLFFFAVLHNFMESDFLEGTAVQWGQFLLILAFLRVSGREARALAGPVPS